MFIERNIRECMDMARPFSSSLLRAIIARNHVPFFKIFSNFVHFGSNVQIFCPFLPFFFFSFSEKSHACPYFLEQALTALGKIDSEKVVKVTSTIGVIKKKAAAVKKLGEEIVSIATDDSLSKEMINERMTFGFYCKEQFTILSKYTLL